MTTATGNRETQSATRLLVRFPRVFVPVSYDLYTEFSVSSFLHNFAAII
jgi:hypothetical protein